MIFEEAAHDADERRRKRMRFPAAGGAREAQGRAREAALRRVPAIHRVVVVCGEERELVLAVVELDAGRRGEAAQQRRHRRLCDARETKRLRLLAHVEHAGRAHGRGFAVEAQRNVAAFRVDQADGERHVERQLVGLPGCGRCVLPDVKRVGMRPRIVGSRTRSTGVPAWLYQRRNCVRSTPDASCMACTKSSHVTAMPSWRVK